MTNFEKITKSPVELAEVLTDVHDGVLWEKIIGSYCKKGVCPWYGGVLGNDDHYPVCPSDKSVVAWWLYQEVEE